jgi:hypothetical protein
MFTIETGTTGWGYFTIFAGAFLFVLLLILGVLV